MTLRELWVSGFPGRQFHESSDDHQAEEGDEPVRFGI